ncbi:MAG: hypothetical protein WBH24_11995, partial [Candidatus Acidiferrum sp.]
MHKLSRLTLGLTIALGATAYIQAQAQSPAQPSDPIPTYRVSVVSRTAEAVSYKHRGGSTHVDFQGTDLMPSATGEAKVESKRGVLGIEAEFSNLDRPTTFGNEYLTYVLWAISPEGRSVNLGEVLVGDNHRSKLEVTTNLQAFALIVTAEPYYAVRRPSNAVILQNMVRPDTKGTLAVVDAKYELIDRGGYIPTGFTFDPVVLDARLPLEFYEARNAVRIAKSAGAEKYAGPSFENAVRQMREADALATSRHEDKKALISVSRETVQTAEDAREIATKRIADARAENERDTSANQVADANSATADALSARNEAERNKLAAQSAAASANQQAQQAKDAQATAEADSDRNRAAAAAADQQAQQARSDQATAEADSERNRAAAAASDLTAQQAVNDREELRAKLLQQFNLILETRDTARGLVVNMSDVLFDSGQYTLKPLAREKLAKISGIVMA